MEQTQNNKKTALIIGAGPAGLTAALELIRHSDIKPIVLEADSQVGGISRTVNYNGNRIDIGGHRFFSKSDWVMQWWQDILPIDPQANSEETINISYQGKNRDVEINSTPRDPDSIMLVRNRLSRIYYEGNFYDYPVKLNLTTIKNLGFFRMANIGMSYIRAMMFPRKEHNLEDFLINRFGKKLYETFFESYTEKVWGVPCREISPEWGAQRIKGLSISKALLHFILSPFKRHDISNQKKGETSLIERFLYPKYGPGQMWETVTEMVNSSGGEVRLNQYVNKLKLDNDVITELSATDSNGETHTFRPDWVISTMPVRNLIESLETEMPKSVYDTATGLPYRDFLTVGLLLRKMQPNSQAAAISDNQMPPDNWIYIQDPGVRLGRVQIFNNWSPDMVNDGNTIWLGLEYFCNEGDDLWDMQDEAMKEFAAKELQKIGLIDVHDVLDGVVIRMPKAYPAYFGTYDNFDEVRKFTDSIENLYLVGRNGMHRYNNQDHSMLAAKTCVESIVSGQRDQAQLWSVNAEDDYHEEK